MLPVSLLSAIIRHRRKSLLGRGVLPLSAQYSTFDVTPAVFDANGVAVADIDITAKDSANAAIPGLSGPVTVATAYVSAADSLVVAAPSTIANDGAEACTIDIYLFDEDGYPVWGLDASLIVVAVSGTGNTVTQPTGETDYQGHILASFVSTGAATKTVTVTVNGRLLTDQPSVIVSGSAPATVFTSEWGTGTGFTDAVIRDTSGATPWAGTSDTSGNCLQVVSAASVGADSGTLTGYAGNCLRIEIGNSSGDGQVLTGNLFAASTTHWIRDYIRSDSGRRSNHGGGTFEAGDLANWQILAHVHRGGTDETSALRLGWEINLNVGGGGRDYQSPALSKGVWYRREVMLEFNPLDGTQYRPFFRIYDIDGVLLYDNDDFTRVDGTGGPATLTADLATVGGWVSLGTVDNPADTNGTRAFVLGSEDPSDATGYNPSTPNYIYHAKVAVSTEGWVGA